MSKRLEITFPQDAPYALIRAHETVTSDLAREVIREVTRILEETSIRSFLMDVRGVRGDVSPIENYDIAYKGVQLAYKAVNQERLNQEVKFALLASPGDTTHSFAETVGRNAGNNITLFHDFNRATEWLQGSD